MATPQREGSFISGAVVSGLLVAAAFAGAPFLVWFALAPLLAALDRRRDSPRALAIQGAVFGIVLGAAGLPWLGDPASALLPEGIGGLLEHAPRAAPGCLVLALAGAGFGIAAGGLLGMRTAILTPTKAPAIAVVWAGIEGLLGLCPSGLSPWMGGWLALGYAIPPEYPEAQIARIGGVVGLSFAAALSSAFLAAGLRAGARGWMACVLCLALSLGIPFGCRWAGSAAPAGGGGTAVMVGVVSAPGDEPDRIVSLVDAMTLSGPSLVALPALEDFRRLDEAKRALEAGAAERGRTLPTFAARTKSETMEASEVLLGGHRIGVVHGRANPTEMLMALPHLAWSGSEALVIIGDDSATAAEARRQRMLDAYRAIACGRYVIRSGPGAAIHDPSGRMLAGISPPLEGGVSAEIGLSREVTPYADGLWLLGERLGLPLFAGVFVIGAGLSFRERRVYRQ